jgi:hypothetical protein
MVKGTTRDLSGLVTGGFSSDDGIVDIYSVSCLLAAYLR